MPIVFLYLQLHSGEHGRLALSYLQFVQSPYSIVFMYMKSLSMQANSSGDVTTECWSSISQLGKLPIEFDE